MAFLKVWWRDWNEGCMDELDLQTVLTALSVLSLGVGIGNAPKDVRSSCFFSRSDFLYWWLK